MPFPPERRSRGGLECMFRFCDESLRRRLVFWPEPSSNFANADQLPAMGAMIEGKWDTGHHLLLPFRYKIALQMAPSSNCTAGQNHLDCAQGLQHYLFEEFVFREVLKRPFNWPIKFSSINFALIIYDRKSLIGRKIWPAQKVLGKVPKSASS